MKDLFLRLNDIEENVERMDRRVRRASRKATFGGIVNVLQTAAIAAEFFALVGIVKELKEQKEIATKNKGIF